MWVPYHWTVRLRLYGTTLAQNFLVEKLLKRDTAKSIAKRITTNEDLF